MVYLLLQKMYLYRFLLIHNYLKAALLLTYTLFNGFVKFFFGTRLSHYPV